MVVDEDQIEPAQQTPAGHLIRYCSRYPNQHGAHVGLFGMVNVLGRHGMLAPDEEQFRREANAWYEAAYPDPCRANPNAYDHPRTASWFRSSATSLLTRIPGYLAILDSHRIAWQQLVTSDPGRIVYEDAVQVVAVAPYGRPGT